ncbi:MAG TPA: hypothetical protein DGT53_01595 [Dialister sp.]|nr:hypothetical protein [Dialister sp.]
MSPFALPAAGGSPVKALPYSAFCTGALGFGADTLDDDAPFPLFYGTSRVLMLLFKGSIVRNLIKEGDERT